jgi:hypothetical protein
MKEEILDDTINVEGEDYVYLQVIEHYNPILTKLAVALGVSLMLDILLLVKNVFLRSDSAFYYNGFFMLFQLLIDLILLALAYRIWQQKKRQEQAHQQDFVTNEAHFLEAHYKSAYLLGFVFLAIIIRTLFFILIY